MRLHCWTPSEATETNDEMLFFRDCSCGMESYIMLKLRIILLDVLYGYISHSSTLEEAYTFQVSGNRVRD